MSETELILVTGATGMIGRALVRRLSAEGYSVKAHARSTLTLKELFPMSANIEHAIADFADLNEESARQLCSGCTAVIHGAGLAHRPDANAELYETYNVRASKLLADAAKHAGVKQFIFISSSSVYGNCATNMIKETAATKTDTPYASSKIATEEYLCKSPPAPATFIIRPSLVFGEGDRGNMLSLIRQVLSGKYFIVGSGSARKSLIYANDFAFALSAVLRSSKEGSYIFNLANVDPVTVKKLSESILAAAGLNRSLLSMPSWLISIGASVANLFLGHRSPLSPDRLAKLTRNNAVSVEDFVLQFGDIPQTDLVTALREEIAWARADGKIPAAK